MNMRSAGYAGHEQAMFGQLLIRPLASIDESLNLKLEPACVRLYGGAIKPSLVPSFVLNHSFSRPPHGELAARSQAAPARGCL